jgi:hypothetical protein
MYYHLNRTETAMSQQHCFLATETLFPGNRTGSSRPKKGSIDYNLALLLLLRLKIHCKMLYSSWWQE